MCSAEAARAYPPLPEPVLVQRGHPHGVATPGGVDEPAVADVDAVVPEAIEEDHIADLQRLPNHLGACPILLAHGARQGHAEPRVDRTARTRSSRTRRGSCRPRRTGCRRTSSPPGPPRWERHRAPTRSSSAGDSPGAPRRVGTSVRRSIDGRRRGAATADPVGVEPEGDSATCHWPARTLVLTAAVLHHLAFAQVDTPGRDPVDRRDRGSTQSRRGRTPRQGPVRTAAARIRPGDGRWLR